MYSTRRFAATCGNMLQHLRFRIAAEPVSQCLRPAGSGGDVDNGYVDVGNNDKVNEKRSMEVGVTGRDKVQIVVE